MNLTPEKRFRLRYTLIAIIFFTLPCYCAGLVMVRLAESQRSLPLNAPTPLLPEATISLLPTGPANEEASQTPAAPLLPTSTSIVLPSATISPTDSPTATLEPSATPTTTPTATDTETPTPTPTPTDTPEPSATPTPTEASAETPPVIITAEGREGTRQP